MVRVYGPGLFTPWVKLEKESKTEVTGAKWTSYILYAKSLSNWQIIWLYFLTETFQHVRAVKTRKFCCTLNWLFYTSVTKEMQGHTVLQVC